MNGGVEFVVPAHNEAERLATSIIPHLEYFDGVAIFSVAMDHCTDDTAAVVEELHSRYPHVSSYEVEGPQGKGSAVLEGLKRSRESIVGFMDADCPTPPAEMARLVERLDGADGAIGSRYLPLSLIASPRDLLRTGASRALNVSVRSLFRLPYRDTQCGAKVFRRERIEPVLDEIETTNWLFDLDLLLRAREHGLKIEEVPIIWREERGSHLDVIGFAPEALRTLIRLKSSLDRAHPS